MSVKDCDSHKLHYHPKYIVDWMNNKPTPIHAEIGITNRCNHSCTFCVLDWTTHGAHDINTDIYMSTLKEMADMGVKSIYYAGEGEPTLHKDLPTFINYGKSLGMGQALSTNGSVLNKTMSEKIIKDLSWIRFSVDAGTPKTHASIHGVSEKNYDIVLKNIQECVNIKQKHNYNIDIGVQLILLPENIKEVESLAMWCKDNGVDNFQVKPAHSHPKSSFHTGMYKFIQKELKERLEKLEDNNFSIVVRVKSAERLTQEKKYKECHGFDFYVIIDAMGNIVPCSIFYKQPEYIYGNLNDNTFKEIWTSQKRKDIINNITKLNFCSCKEYRCRLDVLNRYLDRIKHPEFNDEFI